MPRRLDMDLTGKKIFISAAGAGMGCSVAKLALNAGAKVYATDLEPAGLEKLSALGAETEILDITKDCLLYTSPSPRDLSTSRMPSSA